MASIGADLAALLGEGEPSLVLTAEASGIPPALAVANALEVPMVYAKKYPRRSSPRPSYAREVSSPTKGDEYRVEVAHRVLGPGERVVVVDDFLSRGRTAEALGEIVEEAGSAVVAFGFVIEKSFMEGRERLEGHGWRVVSLIAIRSLEDGLELEPGGRETGTG